MSRTFSPRTDGGYGKAAARSQTHAAHLTIPQMLHAGNDMQDNNSPTGPEHTEGGDSPAQAPALHTMQAAGATAVDVSADQGRNSSTVSVAGTQQGSGDIFGIDLVDGYIQKDLTINKRKHKPF